MWLALAVLYLNRCPDDCVVDGATLTRLPRLDLAWAQLVICVRETVAPYGVDVVTEPPAGPHHEVMIAGRPEEVGLAEGTVSTGPGTCAPLDEGRAIVFGNLVDLAAEPERALDLCYETARVAGAMWGLGAVDECADVMGPGGCGRPWFTHVPRPSSCGPQDAHATLLARLGGGVDRGPPAVTIVDAYDDVVVARVDSTRTIARLEAGDHVAAGATGEVALPYADEVRAVDDLGRLGGAPVTIAPRDRGCSAGGGTGTAPALALLYLVRRRRR